MVNCPIYNFAKHRRSEETNIFHPNDIIIVEGIMVFQVEQLLKDGYDLKVFVKAKEVFPFGTLCIKIFSLLKSSFDLILHIGIRCFFLKVSCPFIGVYRF